MKKSISFLLCAAVAFTTVFCFSINSFSTEANGADIPTIRLIGVKGSLCRPGENNEKEIIFPFQIPENYIQEQAKAILPVFAKAFFTRKWDEFCDVLYESVSPILSEIKLDKNGEASDGSGACKSWTLEELEDKKKNGKYGIEDYEFFYDWRLDPLETADELRRYIEAVSRVTGAEKVALFGRCMGSTIVAAYMWKYDGERVSKVIHYCSAAAGSIHCGGIFSGETRLPPDGVERYAYDLELGGGPLVRDLLGSVMTLFNKTYGLDATCREINGALDKIYLDIFPRILRDSYATFPSYWSAMPPEYFDKAVETVFYGADISEYAGLMEKVEYYRQNVRTKLYDTMIKQREKGIEYSVIAKYGFQSIPVTVDADVVSDAAMTLTDASFGATTATLTKGFDGEYMKKAKANGTDKYISPDKRVDASTCVFPETTWFVKNLAHSDFPTCVDNLVFEIVNRENFTVNDSEEYPRYLVYDPEKNEISPMTEDNMNTTERYNKSFFQALIDIPVDIVKLAGEKTAELVGKTSGVFKNGNVA